MTTHAMTWDYTNKTVCGVEYKPLRFISHISIDKLNTVDDPCKKCLTIIELAVVKFMYKNGVTE